MKNISLINKLLGSHIVTIIIIGIGLILSIVSFVNVSNWISWLSDYADKNGYVLKDSNSFVYGSIAGILVSAFLVILGLVFILRAKMRHVSPKPVYFLVIAILSIIGLGLTLVIHFTTKSINDVMASKDFISDVNKAEIIAKYNSYNFGIYGWVVIALGALRVGSGFTTWIFAKAYKEEIGNQTIFPDLEQKPQNI